VLIALLLSSCSVFWHYSKKEVGGEILWDRVELYNKTSNNMLGKKTEFVIEGKKGEPIQIYGLLRETGLVIQEPQYVQIKYNEREYFAPIGQIAPVEYIKLRNINPSEIRMPREKDSESWSRAIYFVNRHSSMKMQTQTDYIINTYNPISNGSRGYNIIKRYEGDEVIYSIDVPTRGMNTTFNSPQDARRCGYYILYGKEYGLD